MASIKQYTDRNGQKRYQFQLYVGINPQTGKARKTSRRGFKTQKEATLAASRLELEISKGSFDKKDNNILFEQVYQEWYASYTNTVRESTTVRVPKIFDNHILPAFGKKRIRTITLSDVQRALNQWFKEVKVNYKRWYNFANKVFKYALKQGYITKNPAEMVTMPQRRDGWQRDANKFWTKEQLLHFFSFIDPVEEIEKYTLFRVLAYTGIRRGECLALTWHDINFKQGTLHVNKTITQGTGGKQIVQPPKTSSGRRTIILDHDTVEYLKKWRVRQQRVYLMLGYNTMQPEQLVFANSKNGMKSLNTPGKWLHAIVDDKPELPNITIHKLRHTHATILLEAGASIKEVQDRLGDTDVDTVMNVYAHVSDQQRQNTTDKLTQFMES
ncbi:bacteriophage integrase [Levilactobacillus koreensis JCM 16448]|uniref:Integrase n=1 Tax=Levilactobacillus koreensis TaxID=637971 RepID=A0AAC8UUM3_9LACO|nr:site-specific integrase [Levilactobacillus koreensis]AKP63739.1 integrase [Levilactobacillus koreensis]KRK88719.1 bacteriophage integrase [Levilactobacillus koreensis JCM 16448]